jgi:hypothetical protein
MRQILPYTFRANLYPHPCDEIHQAQEVFRPKMASSPRGLLERIRRRRIRPPDWHMPKLASLVEEENSIFTPCILGLTRFGGRFGYAAFLTECISSNSIGLL